jgi:anti-sigma B factor antagonist
METNPAPSDQPSTQLSGADVVLEHEGSTVIVRVTGDLDLVTTPKLEESIGAALNDEPTVLVIDLTEVRFLASGALSALVAAHQAGAERTRVRVVAASRATLLPLQMTGLGQVLAIFPTQREALAAG